MPHRITVHVDDATGTVAIQWPDRPGVMVVDSGGLVRTGDAPDGVRHTVPAGMFEHVDPLDP